MDDYLSKPLKKQELFVPSNKSRPIEIRPVRRRSPIHQMAIDSPEGPPGYRLVSFPSVRSQRDSRRTSNSRVKTARRSSVTPVAVMSPPDRSLASGPRPADSATVRWLRAARHTSQPPPGSHARTAKPVPSVVEVIVDAMNHAVNIGAGADRYLLHDSMRLLHSASRDKQQTPDGTVLPDRSSLRFHDLRPPQPAESIVDPAPVPGPKFSAIAHREENR